MNNDMDLFFSALAFAAERHREQRRKGGEGSPYVNHLIDVADLLWNTGHVHDPVILASAVLHDVVEDTDTSPEELEQLFGAEVAGIVVELTDDMGLERDERRTCQVEHASALSRSAAVIKIADKISNITDILHYPPVGWTTADKRGYITWGERVVEKLRGTNDAQETLFDDVCRQAHEMFWRA